MKVAKLELTLGCLFAGSIALSTIHPWGNLRAGIRKDAPILEGSNVPDNIRDILGSKCGDCHSEKTHYPFYSHVAPLSWMIDHDVHEARERLNMSRWQSYSVEDRISGLTRMASEVHTGQMPPRLYVLIHPGTRLSPEEQQLVYEWAKSERKQLRGGVGSGSTKSSLESRNRP